MLKKEVKWGVTIFETLIVFLLTCLVSTGAYYAKKIEDHETRIAVLETKAPTLQAQTQLAVDQAKNAVKIQAAVDHLDRFVVQLGEMQKEQTRLIKAVERMTAQLEYVRSP